MSHSDDVTFILSNGPLSGRTMRIMPSNTDELIRVPGRVCAMPWVCEYLPDTDETSMKLRPDAYKQKADETFEGDVFLVPSLPDEQKNGSWWQEWKAVQEATKGKVRSSHLVRGLVRDDDVTKLTVEELRTALEDLRSRAGGWRTGMGGLFGAIFATYAIAGTTAGINSVDGDLVWALPIVVGVSIVFGIISLVLLLRAAEGPTRMGVRVRDFSRRVSVGLLLRRISGTAWNLRAGQVFLWLAAILFAAAVVISWFSN